MASLRTQVLVAARIRQALRSVGAHDGEAPAARAAWHAGRLDTLRAHATSRSRYYREAFAGLDGSPLSELPVLTKATLLERFDDIVTEPLVRLVDVEAFLAGQRLGDRLHGRWWVGATSGSTGRPGPAVFDLDEWAEMLAGAARARRLAGPPPRPERGRVRSAKIASSLASHMSLQLGSTIHDPRKPTLRLSATSPLDEIVAELNRWRPHVLNGFPSILGRLADEQLAGRLAIAPQRVFTSAEPLTPGIRARVAAAWGDEPFDLYVTTEAGTVAGECGAHAGMHVLDDHVVLEVVDEQHQPVAPGELGAKVLLTVLASRTLPLIRYELTDNLRMATEPCACGRPGPVIAAIEGRIEEVVRLPTAAGEVPVHPLVFTAVLDLAPVGGWQVRREPGRLRVLVVEPRPSFDAADLARRLTASLAGVGVTTVPVEVAVVDAIPRGRTGKTPLVTTAMGDEAPAEAARPV